jgi:hypothetical protein
MLDEVLRLLVDREAKRRIYSIRPDMVEQASNLMYENGMLSRPVTYDELIDE